MRTSGLVLAAVLAGIAWTQVRADSAAETAKKAADAAAVSASQAAAYAAQGLQEMQAMDKAISNLTVVVKEMEAGTNTVALAAAREELGKLQQTRQDALKIVAELNAAATEAQTAAEAARDATNGVVVITELNAKAAADQAKLAAQASQKAANRFDSLTQTIRGATPGATAPAGGMRPGSATAPGSSTLLLRPGKTNTQVGLGRRGRL